MLIAGTTAPRLRVSNQGEGRWPIRASEHLKIARRLDEVAEILNEEGSREQSKE